jgi:serine/threonine protein kinase
VSLVHCDIKPDNIVFTDKSEMAIKLIDFGITQNVLKYSRREDCVHLGGTYSYMSISQHKMNDPDYYMDSIVDYMDDFQAIAWMLLYFLNFEFKNEDALKIKEMFYKNYDNPLFIDKIATKRLTKNNIRVIGTLCDYTIKRADKLNRYPTDKKTARGVYYSDYNEMYYRDLQNILDGLE